MAKLSDFLGGVISSVSDARLNSDIQSVRIADLYAKDALLKHFSVPRMRIDKVELTIPIGISSIHEKIERIYKPIDYDQFSSKAYEILLRSLKLKKLPQETSQELKQMIFQRTDELESEIKANQGESALQSFSLSVGLAAQRIIECSDCEQQAKMGKPAEMEKDNPKELSKIDRVAYNLIQGLTPEIKYISDKTILESLEVDVESYKLRDIPQEDKLLIKMTISEQGMEWVNLTSEDGEETRKLLPE